ncbi:ABC-2 family transporter protein [Nocardioides carbamazepini]|uniref:ABC transporter permease n=1 Tax=Nocardioides carbamazepini TaxID=2854259 RepID=UPI00214A7966|nr:ABC-2 family transporter protein [Nocardioides carbamazepini]MCR1783072.1 ABC-2 family transporter protein [Nocardioides carbamazepini]
MRHGAGLIRAVLGIGIANLLAYRADLVLSGVQIALRLVVQIVTIAIIFNHTSVLNGWTAGQMVVLLGVHATLEGWLELLVLPSLYDLVDAVREGSFDFVLIKPIDAQLLTIIQRFNPAGLSTLASGLLVVVVGVTTVGTSASAVGWFILTLVFSAVILSSFVMLLCTTCFWFVNVTNFIDVFAMSFSEAGKWPLAIYPRWLKWGLTVVLPVGFAVTVPSQAITARADGETIAFAFALVIATVVASRLLWRRAIRSYTSASS